MSVRTAWALLLLSALGCAAPSVQEGPAQQAREAPATGREEPVSLDEAARAAARKLEELKWRKSTPSEPLAGADIQHRYQDLLDRPGTPEERKPEILLRLAELAYREEEAAFREAYEAGEDPDVAPKDRYARSIAHYRELTTRYPDTPQALTAFYNLGYLYGEQGDGVRSAHAYGEVLRRDPATPYADEIHMRLGEAAFDDDRGEEGGVHYRAVVEGGRPEYVDKALYKLGWCHYNLEDYGASIEAFARVMEAGRASPDDLRRETLEVMAKSFLEWGGVGPLERFLDANPGVPYGARLFRILGDLYQDSSRFEEAARAYSAGVVRYRTSAEALELERGMLSALLVLRDQERANARRVEWADRYGPGSAWDEVHGGGPLEGERDAMLEEGLRLAALYHHGRAQRGQGGLSRAVTIYGRYLELFGDQTEAGYEMAYSYAQALKEAEDLGEAARWYQRVAFHTGFTAHREDASYRRIEVLEVVYREDPEALGALVQAHEDYANLNPGSPLVPEVLFAEGEHYFESGRFSEARQVFERVVLRFSTHPLVPRAHALIARCEFREGAFAEAESAARTALALGLSAETRETVGKLVAFSIFKQAEAWEAAGELTAANEDFLRLVEEFPSEEAAELALYRAGENLRALGRDEEAARVYERLARSYRSSEYAQSALVLSAEIFSSLGDWREAARTYEELYRSAPEAPTAADALFRSAQAVEKTEVLAEASRLYAEFADAFPEDTRVAEARFREAEALRAQGLTAVAKDRYRRAWEAPVTGDGVVYRSRAALALGRLALEEFEGVELVGDVARQLVRKEDLLAEALVHLGRAASLPFAESFTEALFRAGRAYEQMKEAILTSERPADLTEEEREEYDFLLEEKAFPLEERAVEFYRKGIAAARKAGVHTAWVEAMFARLEELLPWAYQRPEEAVAAWDLPALRRPPEESIP